MFQDNLAEEHADNLSYEAAKEEQAGNISYKADE